MTQEEIRETLIPCASIACKALWAQMERVRGLGYKPSLLGDSLRKTHNDLMDTHSIFIFLTDKSIERNAADNITLNHIQIAADALRAEDDLITEAMKSEPLNCAMQRMGEMSDLIEDACDTFDHTIEQLT